MNEDILDVLLYLFENYPVTELIDDDLSLRDDLDEAGFLPEEVDDAFAWLRGTTAGHETILQPPSASTIRLYSEYESQRLSPACQGYLHDLQRFGVLSGENREIVIDRLLALADEEDGSEDIAVEQVKWVVMMVLSKQPDDTGYTHMEAMLAAEDASAAH